MPNKLLAEISGAFLKEKKVLRYRMKKVSEMSDGEIIAACHAYCESNHLTAEWEQFRKRIESEYCFCSYLHEYIDAGRCYDTQMIACGFIKPNALPDMNIDKERLLKCCNDCAQGL